MASSSNAENSLEYLIAKSTDPFLDCPSERGQFAARLVERLSEDVDGPCVAMKLLSHKMLSPNQDEAFHALEVMERVVAGGGLRCANELDRFRLLNQFVRLLAPRYQGAQTAERVRRRAALQLEAWARAFRHLHRLVGTCARLRRAGLIGAAEEGDVPSIDPTSAHPTSTVQCASDLTSNGLTSTTDLTSTHPTSAGLTSTTDLSSTHPTSTGLTYTNPTSNNPNSTHPTSSNPTSSTSPTSTTTDTAAAIPPHHRAHAAATADPAQGRRLARLLRSHDPADLRAANRLIQGMVRAEESKLSAAQQRRDTMERARAQATRLRERLAAGAAARELSALHDALLASRAALFRLAAETADAAAAGRDDAEMAAILSLNDDLNQVVQLFRERAERGGDATEDQEQLVDVVLAKNSGSDDTDTCLIGLDLETNAEEDVQQVRFELDTLDLSPKPSSGSRLSTRKPTPAIPGIGRDEFAELVDLASTSGDRGGTHGRPDHPDEPHGQVGCAGISMQDDLERLLRENKFEPSAYQLPNDDNNFLLKDISTDIADLEILPSEPIVFLDKPAVKGLLYFARPRTTAASAHNVLFHVATLTFTSTQPLAGVTLYLSAKSSIIAYRNVDVRRHDIAPFSPLRPIQTVNQLFLVLPLSSAESTVEIEFVLSADQFNCTGNFNIPLTPPSLI